MTPNISPHETFERTRSGGVQFLDVRTPAEYEAAHAAGAVNVPLDRLDPAAVPAGPVVLICQRGGRGQMA